MQIEYYYKSCYFEFFIKGLITATIRVAKFERSNTEIFLIGLIEANKSFGSFFMVDLESFLRQNDKIGGYYLVSIVAMISVI